MSKCLFCYQVLKEDEIDFHPKCSKKIFGTVSAPLLHYTLDEIEILAKEIIDTSISVPGVQPKLSLGIIKNLSLSHSSTSLAFIGINLLPNIKRT